jgi:ferredoxin
MLSGYKESGLLFSMYTKYPSAAKSKLPTPYQQTIQKENYMSKQVAIDQEECLGCEACVELCPEIFGFDIDETKAYVLMAEDGDEDCIEEAIASCPAACISYE